MAQTTVLERFSRHFVFQRFNPHDEEHLKAYAYWRMHGRMHPTLRFHLEDPFNNVPSMMEAKIAEAWLAQRPEIVQTVDKEMSGRLQSA